MTNTERSALIGFALACLWSAALTGRARSALHRYTRSIAPEARIRTGVVPAGPLGSLIGRASLATVDVQGGEISMLVTPLAAPTGPFRVCVHRTELRGSRTSALGLPVHRLRIVQADSVLDGGRLILKRELGVIRTGLMGVEVVIDAHSLARVVERRMPTVSDVTVVLADNRVCIQGRSSAPRGAVTLVAEVASYNGDQIVLRNGRLWVDVNEVPTGLAAMMIGAMNPVFSLRDTLGPGTNIAIRKVQVSEGVVRAVLGGLSIGTGKSARQ